MCQISSQYSQYWILKRPMDCRCVNLEHLYIFYIICLQDLRNILLVSKLFLPFPTVGICLDLLVECGHLLQFLRSDTHVRQIRLTFIYRKMPLKKCVDRCKTTNHWELTSLVLLSDCFFSVTPIMPENKIPKGPWGGNIFETWVVPENIGFMWYS